MNNLSLKFKPLTPDKLPDFEQLFGSNGACGGCWCMFPRIREKEFQAGRGDTNKTRMFDLVLSGVVPGLIGYADNVPIGWISLGPREDFPRWKNSKVLAPVDDTPVWTVVCQFIVKDFRRKGVSVELLKAAARCASEQGATILEGYPTDSQGEKRPDPWVWTGLYPAYLKAGFIEVARRSPSRPIMRLILDEK